MINNLKELKKIKRQELQTLARYNTRGMMLTIVLKNENPDDLMYVNQIKKIGEEEGIGIDVMTVSPSLFQDDRHCFIMFSDIETPMLIVGSNPSKELLKLSRKQDVDSCNPYNNNIPCTVRAVLDVMSYFPEKMKNKNVVLLGRSNNLGRPLADNLLPICKTLTVCNSQTEDLKKYISNADLVISCVGSPYILTSEDLKNVNSVIDVGISVIDNKVMGDIHPDAYEIVDLAIPSPGGLGRLTILNILKQTILYYVGGNNE